MVPAKKSFEIRRVSRLEEGGGGVVEGNIQTNDKLGKHATN